MHLAWSTAPVLALLLALPQRQWASDTAPSEDQIGAGAKLKYEAVMAQAFPLHSDAVPWDSINYTRYTKIIVSGPQRSGTTFFAKALAAHLGYEHWDENRQGTINTDGGTLKLNGNTPLSMVLKVPRLMVLQRPQLSHIIHKLPESPEVFVAFLARNCLDVFRSQNRILNNDDKGDDSGWTCKYGRQVEWSHYHSDPILRSHVDSEHDMICTIKQQVYRRYQRGEMGRRGIATMPIAYDSFQTLGHFCANSSQLGAKEMTF